MNSLSDLPIDILDNIIQHLNQFQALKLAPLHSKFQNVVKRKLYSHIFVYGEYVNEDRCMLDELLADPEVHKIHETINNAMTNKWTVVHEYSIIRHLSQMDPNQPIIHLEMNSEFEPTLKSILEYFKSIKYLTPAREKWSKDPELDCLVPSARGTFYNAYNINGEWAKKIHENPNKFDYIHKVDIDMADLHYFNQLPKLKHLCVHIKPHHEQIQLFPCTLKLHTLKVYCENSEFDIKKYFDTLHIRHLSIDSPRDPEIIFGTGSLDDVYPSLKVLVISQDFANYNHELSNSTFDLFKKFNHLSHASLNEFHIKTFGYSEDLVQDICKLTLRFPNTSINWWDLDLFECKDDLLLLAVAPRMAPSCIGFYWDTERPNMGLEALPPYSEPYHACRTHTIMSEDHEEKIVKFETPFRIYIW